MYKDHCKIYLHNYIETYLCIPNIQFLDSLEF